MDLAQALAIQQQLCTLETELYKHESFIKTQQVAVMNLKMLLNQQVGYINSCSRDVVSVQPMLEASGSQLHQGLTDDHIHLAMNNSHSSPKITSAVNVDHCIKKMDCAQGSAHCTGEGTSNRLKRARPMMMSIPDGDGWIPNRVVSTMKRRAISKVLCAEHSLRALCQSHCSILLLHIVQ